MKQWGRGASCGLAALAAALVLCALPPAAYDAYRRAHPPVVINGELAFETLARTRGDTFHGRYYHSHLPGLLVLTGRHDLPQASRYVSDEVLWDLRHLDWDDHFAIIAFMGWQAYTMGTFQVDRVVRQEGEVAVFASSGLSGDEPIASSPYHVITLRKTGAWSGPIVFRYFLNAQGEVAAVTREVPERRR